MVGFAYSTYAQEQLGLRIENYSGVNSILLNPSANVSNPLKWDINLVSFGLFADNNYGYVLNTSLINATKMTNASEVIFIGDVAPDYRPAEDDILVDYYNTNRRKYYEFLIIGMAPSFILKLESGHSFGLFANIRTSSNTHNIPVNLGYYKFNETPFYEPINATPFDLAGMVWGEIGLNYAYNFPTASGTLALGGSIKWLRGFEGFYFKTTEDIEFVQLPGDSLIINHAKFDLAYTNSNIDLEQIDISVNGGGISFDLGATLLIDNYGEGYQWKLGASLLDIGKIKFKKNALKHVYDSDHETMIPLNDYSSIEKLGGYPIMLSQQIYGDSLASLSGNQFSIWLPGALSLQADYRINDHFFANGTLIQRLPVPGMALERANILALSLRFETRWFGASLPFIFHNYRSLRIGGAVRIGFLTLGSDNLASLIGKSDFTGTDFYLALKINPFDLGLNLDGRGKGAKCYEF